MNVADTANDVIDLAALLGPFDDIKRITKVSTGSYESDSHHSFSIALIGDLVARRYCPELNRQEVMRFALVHDLLELITGDEPTLHHDHQAHLAKKQRELEATAIFKEQFKNFPEIIHDIEIYERLDRPESAFVYVLDKACTVWTHFPDNGANLLDLGINTRADIDEWYKRLQAKIDHNLNCEPPRIARDILDQSFKRMRAELLND